jgi:predicted nucleotidyltransferase
VIDTHAITRTTLRILGLYRNDYTKSSHPREIARELNVSANTSDLQLKRLETMRVLVRTRKGKNVNYSLNLDNIIAKYYLSLAETFATITFLEDHFLIKKIIRELDEHVEGVIILFGSFAKGQATELSDIDLFVLSDQLKGSVIDHHAFTEIEMLIGREISAKTMTTKQFIEGLQRGAPLVWEVVADHIVLKGIDTFCDVLWRHYAHAR